MIMVKKVSPQRRIAVVGAKGVPPKQGGIEHHCAELYSRIAKRGYQVDLFARASYTQQGWYRCSQFAGVRVISLPSLRLAGVDALIAAFLGSVAVTLRRYEVVHFHAVGLALFCWLPRFFTPAKVVVTCHGLDWQRSKWGKLSSLLIHLGERMSVLCAHEIIVVSEALQSYFWTVYGRETVYIPNAPVPFAAPEPDAVYVRSLNLQPQKYVVFVGRLVPEKAPDLLIQAFHALETDFKLVLVGGESDTSAYLNYLEHLAREGNGNIIFTGQLLGQQLAEVVRQAGLFILPSKLEGMPIALMEGMHEGIPVIVSNIPPHQNLVTDERGVLFEQGNQRACTEALRWAIDHPQQMTAKAKRARRYICSNYSWDQSAVDTICLYRFLAQADRSWIEPDPASKQIVC
jgi:glycosyltransferase involved in cell wall biosynthesis